MDILVIHGHPEKDSFGAGLADAYEAGARAAGHDVRVLRLRDLEFDPLLRSRSHRSHAPEPDLERARADILWAKHVVVQYPTWWASTPALLKGFFDRTLVPGFAYRYRDPGRGWDKLLSGRTARLLVTMDAPAIGDALYYFASSRRAVAKGVMAFCGIAPTRVTTFAPIKSSTDARREAWLVEAKRLGERAA